MKTALKACLIPCSILSLLLCSMSTWALCGASKGGGCAPPRHTNKSCCRPKNDCCANMGGVNYCDSSAGRLVCNNGYYSACYCTRHAVMNIQRIEGCCLWHGGVETVPETGIVACRDGTISESCTSQLPVHINALIEAGSY